MVDWRTFIQNVSKDRLDFVDQPVVFWLYSNICGNFKTSVVNYNSGLQPTPPLWTGTPQWVSWYWAAEKINVTYIIFYVLFLKDVLFWKTSRFCPTADLGLFCYLLKISQTLNGKDPVRKQKKTPKTSKKFEFSR